MIKKYLVIISGVILVVAGLAVINLAQAVEEETVTSTASSTINVSSTSTASSSPAEILPIIKDIAEEELRQELSIKEIKGRIIRCMAAGDCPTTPEAKYSTEVLIKAAKVTEVAANYLKISIFGYVYKVDISGSKLVRHYWGPSEIDEFSVGDIVNVFGYLDPNDNYLIYAKTVRNVSIQKIHNTFKGVIESVDATSTSFILATEERGKQTVKINNDTKIIKVTAVVCVKAPCPPQEVQGSFADLQAGMKVIVRGIWDKTTATIQARVIILGGENTPRLFFQKKPQIEKFVQKIENKIEKETEKEGGKSKARVLEDIQKKILEIIKQLKSATSTTTSTQ